MGDRVGGSITETPLPSWNRRGPQGLHLLRVKISCLALSKHPSSHTKLTVNLHAVLSPPPAYPTQSMYTHRAYKPDRQTQSIQTTHTHRAYKPHTRTRTQGIQTTTQGIRTTYTHDRTSEGRRTQAAVLSSRPGFTMFWLSGLHK